MNRVLLLKTWRDLRFLRVQAFSAAFLIACGMGLLVSSLSAWESLRRARDHFYENGRFAHGFGSVKKAPNSQIVGWKRIPGVTQIEPRIRFMGHVHPKGQKEPASGLFLSAPPPREGALNQLHLLAGELPREQGWEICVHAAFAEAHGIFPGDDLSIQLEGTRQTVKVSGIALSPEFVYALSPVAPLPDDRHFGVFWMNHRRLESLSGMTGAFNDFSFRAQKELLPEIVRSFEQELVRFGGRSVTLRKDQLSNRFVEDEIRQQRITAFFFPSVFLGVAAFLIHVMTTRLVALHRTQIGTLKAMGYRDREVGLHYFLFSVLLPSMGVLPGLGLGWGVGKWMSHSYEDFFRFPNLDFSLSPSAAGMGLFAALFSGVLGGALSVRSAARMTPSEAMRPWVPIYFKKRAQVFSLSLPPKVLMVIRNTLASPLRLGLTLLGLSAAVSLLVMSRSWNDMITSLLRTQFSKIQKEDLSLALVKPVPLSGIQELRAKTSVLEAEGVRTVPVRIHHRQFSRDLVLTAWGTNEQLREFPQLELEKPRSDPKSRADVLKPQSRIQGGVAMSRALAEQWGLRLGDLVYLDFLEGTRSPLSVVLSAFTDDRMGRSLNTSSDFLRDILREESVSNQVLLRVDSLKKEELYGALRQSPWVLAIFLKKELVTSFRNTVAAMIEVSTWVLTGFAMGIALGVIVNSIRVSYSERSWELSSLRVLGMKTSEVFWLFWAEIAFQVLLCLGPGCLLGLGLVHLSMKALHTESIGFPVIVFGSTYARAILFFLGLFAITGVSIWRLIQKIRLGDALKARD